MDEELSTQYFPSPYVPLPRSLETVLWKPRVPGEIV